MVFARVLLIMGILALVFCTGGYLGQATFEPQVIIEQETHTIYQVIEKVVLIEKEVIKEVPSFELKEFATQDALSKWQAENYIGDREGWNCVDYALELQRRALLDGYQMSTETLIDKGGKTGHMICSTVIGDEIIFLEPQSTISWVGGIRGDAGITYRPISYIYSPEGNPLKEIYREE